MTNHMTLLSVYTAPYDIQCKCATGVNTWAATFHAHIYTSFCIEHQGEKMTVKTYSYGTLERAYIDVTIYVAHEYALTIIRMIDK